MEKYDVIVIGSGGVGSAALFQLARRGACVLGLDPFSPGHAHGSSHGQTRIIRQAYFEHSDYVPLLLRAYQLWHEIEEQAGEPLFRQVGLIELGPADGVVIPGVLRSVEQHHLPIETMTNREAQQRFPFLRIPEDLQVVFEPTAGYLHVERCVKTHVRLARQAGAAWRQERVVSWKALPGGISVDTETGRYAGGKLIVCGGAWATCLLADLSVPLRVLVKQQYWFPCPSREADAGSWPTYFFEVPSGCFYGFPQINEAGVKVARHDGGLARESPVPLAEITDPADERMVRDFVDQHLRGVTPTPTSQQACMYTMSPDGHFLVDRHPDSEHVVVVAGLSGHGFKFTPMLGEVAADLALEGSTRLPIDFLRLSRFG